MGKYLALMLISLMLLAVTVRTQHTQEDSTQSKQTQRVRTEEDSTQSFRACRQEDSTHRQEDSTQSKQSLRTEDLKPPATVSYVDVDKYLGVWYKQSSIPTPFEKGCTKTNATYSLNDDDSIRVNNTCTRGTTVSSTIGKAVAEDDTNAKLRVQFGPTPGSGGEYWIVRLGKKYEYAVVSNSDYSYLWILARVPKMDEDLYKKIVNDLKCDGFPVQKLVRDEQ